VVFKHKLEKIKVLHSLEILVSFWKIIYFWHVCCFLCSGELWALLRSWSPDSSSKNWLLTAREE
jgi:hypothetical protein